MESTPKKKPLPKGGEKARHQSMTAPPSRRTADAGKGGDRRSSTNWGSRRSWSRDPNEKGPRQRRARAASTGEKSMPSQRRGSTSRKSMSKKGKVKEDEDDETPFSFCNGGGVNPAGEAFSRDTLLSMAAKNMAIPRRLMQHLDRLGILASGQRKKEKKARRLSSPVVLQTLQREDRKMAYMTKSLESHTGKRMSVGPTDAPRDSTVSEIVGDVNEELETEQLTFDEVIADLKLLFDGQTAVAVWELKKALDMKARESRTSTDWGIKESTDLAPDLTAPSSKELGKQLLAVQNELAELKTARATDLATRREQLDTLKENFREQNDNLAVQLSEAKEENAQLTQRLTSTTRKNAKLQSRLSLIGEKNLAITHELQLLRGSDHDTAALASAISTSLSSASSPASSAPASPEVTPLKSPEVEVEAVKGVAEDTPQQDNKADDAAKDDATKKEEETQQFPREVAKPVGDGQALQALRSAHAALAAAQAAAHAAGLDPNAVRVAPALNAPINTTQMGNRYFGSPMISGTPPMGFDEARTVRQPGGVPGMPPIPPGGGALGVGPDNVFPYAPAIPGVAPVGIPSDLVTVSKTYYGSHYIQQQLDQEWAALHGSMDQDRQGHENRPFFTQFFEQVRKRVYEVMTNKFGRFSFEKMLGQCTDEERLVLLRNLTPTLSAVACDTHGSFGTQVLIRSLRKPEHMDVVAGALERDILTLIVDYKGHYLVVVLVTQFPYERFKFIDEQMVVNCLMISTNNQGLQVMKALFKFRTTEQLLPLLKVIATHTMDLCEDQYGNYVVQQALLKCHNDRGDNRTLDKNGKEESIGKKARKLKEAILRPMEGNFRRLSQQKFSSNVVELCLKHNISSHWVAVIVRELVAPPPNQVKNLVNDRYGNYVLQSALATAERKQVQQISDRLSPHLMSFRPNLRSKWTNLINQARDRVRKDKSAGGGNVMDMGHHGHHHHHHHHQQQHQQQHHHHGMYQPSRGNAALMHQSHGHPHHVHPHPNAPMMHAHQHPMHAQAHAQAMSQMQGGEQQHMVNGPPPSMQSSRGRGRARGRGRGGRKHRQPLPHGQHGGQPQAHQHQPQHLQQQAPLQPREQQAPSQQQQQQQAQ